MCAKYLQWKNYQTATTRFWIEKEWPDVWEWRVKNLTVEEVEYLLRDIIRKQAFEAMDGVNLYSVLLAHAVEQIDFKEIARALKGAPIERDRSMNEQLREG